MMGEGNYFRCLKDFLKTAWRKGSLFLVVQKGDEGHILQAHWEVLKIKRIKRPTQEMLLGENW